MKKNKFALIAAIVILTNAFLNVQSLIGINKNKNAKIANKVFLKIVNSV